MSRYNWNHCAYCKYNSSKQCSSEFSCLRGNYCSSNPNRFNGRDITKGQIKFLIEHGFSIEQIEDLDFKSAVEKINALKR